MTPVGLTLRFRPVAVRRVPLAACLTLSLMPTWASAMEEADPSASADPLPPDSLLSREAWRQRVLQARERAEQARRDAAARPREPQPPPPSPEQLATDRVLNDETLQVGDVVATEKGLFQLRGRLDDGRLILQPLPRR